jgi:hypothetical protein
VGDVRDLGTNWNLTKNHGSHEGDQGEKSSHHPLMGFV